MKAIRAISDVDQDGTATVHVPPSLGKRVEIIVLPVDESEISGFYSEEDRQSSGGDLDFLAGSYLAVVEEDEDEDAIWESYIDGQP